MKTEKQPEKKLLWGVYEFEDWERGWGFLEWKFAVRAKTQEEVIKILEKMLVHRPWFHGFKVIDQKEFDKIIKIQEQKIRTSRRIIEMFQNPIKQ